MITLERVELHDHEMVGMFINRSFGPHRDDFTKPIASRVDKRRAEQGLEGPFSQHTPRMQWIFSTSMEGTL